MIYKFKTVLRSIAEAEAQAGLPDGRYVQAVCMPFIGGLLDNLRDCWEVICGRAHVFYWPKEGELEDGTRRWRHRHAARVIGRAYEKGTINSAQLHILAEQSGFMMRLAGYHDPYRSPAVSELKHHD